MEKIERIKSIINGYNNWLEVVEKRKLFDPYHIYNKIAKYLLLGGKLPKKYKLHTEYRVSKSAELLKSPTLFYDVFSLYRGVHEIVEDIANNKLKLKPIKNFNKNHIKKLEQSSKQYEDLRILEDKLEKEHKKSFENLTKDLSNRGKTKAFFKLVMEALDSLETKNCISFMKETFNSNEFIENVCFSYNHNYKSLSRKEKNEIKNQCKAWIQAIKNNLYDE